MLVCPPEQPHTPMRDMDTNLYPVPAVSKVANRETIEFLRNNSSAVIGRFFVRVKVASYVNKKLWRRKTFKSSIKYINNKSSISRVLTEANREILSNSIFLKISDPKS